MVLRLRLLPARGRASHFLLRPGSVILQPGVLQAMVKADWPAAFPRLARATEKGSRQVVAVSFVARFSPALVCFSFAVDMVKGSVVVVALSCFFTPRSSF